MRLIFCEFAHLALKRLCELWIFFYTFIWNAIDYYYKFQIIVPEVVSNLLIYFFFFFLLLLDSWHRCFGLNFDFDIDSLVSFNISDSWDLRHIWIFSFSFILYSSSFIQSDWRFSEINKFFCLQWIFFLLLENAYF